MMNNGNAEMFESLEGRQLFSAAGRTITAPAVTTASALVAKPAILSPSAVIGTYKGSATLSPGGDVLPVVIKVTSTRVYSSINGASYTSVRITARQFKLIREGTFHIARSIDGEAIDLTATVGSGGKRMNGTFTASGTITASGTVVLRKV